MTDRYDEQARSIVTRIESEETLASVTAAVAAALRQEAKRIAALEADLAKFRTTNRELNARATKAEAAMLVTVADCRRQGVSLGRVLANAGYAMMEARVVAAEAEVARLTKREEMWSACHDDNVGALSDAGVGRNDDDEIASGIESLAKDRDELLAEWNKVGSIFWPDREPEDRWSSVEVAAEVRALREAFHDAYTEGWLEGHAQGISCGHPLDRCLCGERKQEETDWESSEARALAAGAGT